MTGAEYWRQRYADGGNSGTGSEGALAQWKAEQVGMAYRTLSLSSVLDLGCGDGRQGKLLTAYIPRNAYFCADPAGPCLGVGWVAWETIQATSLRWSATLSLDVLYHLTDDAEYDEYMRLLFRLATRAVMIYAPDFELPPGQFAEHIRPRRFSSWVVHNAPQWALWREVRNPYTWDGTDVPEGRSFCDFYAYRRA